MRPRVAASALLLLSAVLVTGCAPPMLDACTTIGFLNVLTVELPSATDDVDVVVCGEDWCSSEAANSAGVILERREGDTWRFSSASWDEQLTIRVLDAAGFVVVEEEVEPDWVRVGGDERCGGPHEATVTID